MVDIVGLETKGVSVRLFADNVERSFDQPSSPLTKSSLDEVGMV